jgi:hypothetical protein
MKPGVVRVDRVYPHPREAVWRALTTPALLDDLERGDEPATPDGAACMSRQQGVLEPILSFLSGRERASGSDPDPGEDRHSGTDCDPGRDR